MEKTRLNIGLGFQGFRLSVSNLIYAQRDYFCDLSWSAQIVAPVTPSTRLFLPMVSWTTATKPCFVRFGNCNCNWDPVWHLAWGVCEGVCVLFAFLWSPWASLFLLVSIAHSTKCLNATTRTVMVWLHKRNVKLVNIWSFGLIECWCFHRLDTRV